MVVLHEDDGAGTGTVSVEVDAAPEVTVETVLTTHHATLEPGFVVLPALSGALLK